MSECKGFNIMPKAKRAMQAIEAVQRSVDSADRVREDGVLVVVEDRAALKTSLLMRHPEP